jgi:hypothetical protein
MSPSIKIWYHFGSFGVASVQRLITSYEIHLNRRKSQTNFKKSKTLCFLNLWYVHRWEKV